MQTQIPYKTALVTGASRGIGAEICRHLSQLGLSVHAVARDSSKLDAICAETGATAHVADVTDTAAMKALLRELTVDVLVNNAGAISALGSLETLSADDIDRMIDVNLRAPLQLCRAALTGMVQRRRGHIINIGSTAGTFVFPGTAAYAAAKAGMTAANRVLRHDLAGSNVRVTEISPGRVHTDIYRQALDNDSNKVAALYDNMRSVHPDDIARAVVTALTMRDGVDISFMEVVPTDQAPGGHRYPSAENTNN